MTSGIATLASCNFIAATSTASQSQCIRDSSRLAALIRSPVTCRSERLSPHAKIRRSINFSSVFSKKSVSIRTVHCSASVGEAVSPPFDALLFDCDGVLVDTERDGHRVSFNQAFKEKGWEVEWGVDLYGELLRIGGGKERMSHYFNKVGWPAGCPQGEGERKAVVAELHKRKTSLFMELVDTGALPLRPGVARLVDEAFSNGVQVAVCSTSNEKAVGAIVREMLGAERAAKMTIFAGDVVPRKKPDSAIYTLAATTLGVDPKKCCVVEDSHIGLTAAKAAGMTCVVTKSGYTADEDFSAADSVFDCIGDAPEERFGLARLAELVVRQSASLLS